MLGCLLEILRYSLILESSQRLETIFLATASIWFAPVKFLSINTPQNLLHATTNKFSLLQVKWKLLLFNPFLWGGNKHNLSFRSVYSHSIFSTPFWKFTLESAAAVQYRLEICQYNKSVNFKDMIIWLGLEQ